MPHLSIVLFDIIFLFIFQFSVLQIRDICTDYLLVLR